MLRRAASDKQLNQYSWQLKSVLGVLLFSMVLSSLGIVYVRHSTREMFNEWHQLQALRDEMNIEWTQLLLERSTLSAEGRVDYIAQHSLHMRPPERSEVVWVEQ